MKTRLKSIFKFKKTRKVFGIILFAFHLFFGSPYLVRQPKKLSLSKKEFTEISQPLDYNSVDNIGIDIEGIDNPINNNKGKNSNLVVKTGSGVCLSSQNKRVYIDYQTQKRLEVSGGDNNLSVPNSIQQSVSTKSGSKVGAAARAKHHAKQNVQRSTKAGSILLPGADGFIFPISSNGITASGTYTSFHKSSDTILNATQDNLSPNDSSDFGKIKKGSPTVQSQKSGSKTNRQKRIESKPIVVETEYQETNVLITKKDIKKWITQEERAVTTNQQINEQTVEKKYSLVVANPDEVIQAIHIHKEGTRCNVYLKDLIIDTNGLKENQKFAVIVDLETGRASLGSMITNEEYEHLKVNSEINLTDLRRDPKTLAMNSKSVLEAETLMKAKNQGCLEKYREIRRPFNDTEVNSDFVGINATGGVEPIHIKKIYLNNRPFPFQARDINGHLDKLYYDYKGNGTIICDVSAAPSHMQPSVVKGIQQDLEPYKLENVDFVF